MTRLADASSVFVAKEKITPLVQRRIDELEAAGAAMTVVLCTGAFKGLRAHRALVTPEKVLVGVLRGVAFPGRLGVICPSTRHVPQTEARWRGHGFDPVVVPLSPYDHGPDPGAADVSARPAWGSCCSTAWASDARPAASSRTRSACPWWSPTSSWPASWGRCSGSEDAPAEGPPHRGGGGE